MILTRSKFHYTVTLPNAYCTRVVYTIIIGTGSTTSITPLKTITTTKQVPTAATTKSWIDISDFIRDWYDIVPFDFTGISAAEIGASSAQAVLVASVEAAYTDSIGSLETPDSQKFICSDGYNYYLDGVNVEPTKKILLSHNNYKADNRGYFIVPLRAVSGDSDPTVNGVTVGLSFSDTNTNYIKYLKIPVANYSSSFDVVFGGETITIEPITECKYPLTQIQFLNRYGALEIIHFYKAKVEKTSIGEEVFKGGYYDGSTYAVTKHQNQRFNITQNESVRIETGFLNEDYNSTIRELLATEKAWLGQVPINVKTTSLDLKTRIVDKLISYNIEFDYAFDKINTI